MSGRPKIMVRAAIAKLRRMLRPGSPRRSSLVCHVCGEMDLSLYMVKDEVWAEAGLATEDLAHPTCLAKRLGRPLRLEDFTDAPCNDIVWAIFDPYLPRKRDKQIRGQNRIPLEIERP